MYTNFTEETCTGTGDTLALAGATSGNLPFSASFADGDLISYSLVDSGGSIKVAGVGVYVSATDDITRRDTWNYNGSVVDKAPTTNITLSGGTHTIQCTALSFNLPSGLMNKGAYNNMLLPHNHTNLSSTAGTGANTCWFIPVFFAFPTLITSLITNLTVADGACANARLGIYSSVNGGPSALLRDTGDVSSTFGTTGVKTSSLTSPILLPAGFYFFAIASDSTTLTYNAPSVATYSFLQNGIDISATGRNRCLGQTGVTGALPSTASPNTSASYPRTPVGFG